ncbi:trans-4-hydroxy-L-proline dehydratase activase [Sedimentibacter sp.]|uniref:trans-4-hydroxy-L-proline dehydratase activase n=1 Tax=Sedimentibacter sp. TaxID=1960295 RepID=UPI0028A70439|nr:trans-4-hydroxy-L-proline dehydratase activase [Sedimentibacter sp.]
MSTATIFNIQKFSIHDGPGIRTTVFFKGCPLKCLWCHNPESQENKKQILYDTEKCVLCGTCVKVCPQDAIKIENNVLTTDMDKCDFCGLCEIYCIQEARQVVGKDYNVGEILKEVLKDRIFYEKSNGGVTVSGGEPLMYVDFIEELFKKLKEENIHTAVDTSGAVNFKNLERIAEYTDLFLYDIKLMDDEKHNEYIKASNKTILENLKKLSKIHNNINIRLPIVEGVNADIAHIEKTIDFIKDLNIKKVNLLPYHDIAKHKYKKLGIDYEEEKMSKPSEEKMQCFVSMFESKGYEVKIGG